MRLFKSRPERIIFFTALIAAGVAVAVYIMAGHASRPLLQISSDSYMPQAISLYERGAFTNSTTTPYLPEATNVPGYPLFLAFTAVAWGTVIPTLLIQALLFAISGVLLLRLFEGVFSERIRFFAALVFVVEPYTVFTVAQALSETLFLFLLLLGIYVGRGALERGQVPRFFFAAVLLAAATLTRPILLYALPILLIVPLVVAYRRNARILWTLCVAGVLGLLVVLGPWAYRNHEAFGIWTLETKGAYTLYFYDTALLLQYRDGISDSEANSLLFNNAKLDYPEIRTADDLRQPKYASYLTHESAAIITGAPLQFAKMYAASLVTFFLSDGYRLLWYEFSDGAISLPNITKAVSTGRGDILIAYVQNHPLQAGLLLFGVLFWGVVLALSGIAVLSAGRLSQGGRTAVLFCLCMVAYFALLTGPVAQARYRIVATPFLFMLAAYGASVLFPLMKKHVTRYVL